MKRGQASAEYLILLSFIMGIVLIVVILFQSYMQETQDSIRLAQADQLAHKIVDTAEKVYYLGEPSKMTIKAHMPGNVKSITLANKEVYFLLGTSQGDNEVGTISKVNITGNLATNEGVYEILVESKGDYVQISSS